MATQEGAQFLSDAGRRHSHIAAFDHPTLSISPMLNAIDLENALAPDLVCEI